MLPLILGGASLIGGLLQSKQASKSADAAAKASQVDIDALDQKTREIARKNAFESAELERQLTPEVSALRERSNRAVLSGLTPSDTDRATEQALLSRLGGQVGQNMQTPLLRAAIAKAKANLELGGNLSTDVKNAVTRRSAAATGAAFGNLGLGRDVSSRDLGLTSMDVESQRLREASALGQQEMGLETADNDLAFNNAANLLNQIQLLRSISGDGFNRSLSAAQFGESIARPVVGLDPGSVADVTVGNSNNRSAALANKANIQGNQAQSLTGFGGQMLGYGLMSKRPQQPKKSTPDLGGY